MGVTSQFVKKASDIATRFKSRGTEAQSTEKESNSSRSDGTSTEKGRGTSFHRSGSALDLSQSDNPRDSEPQSTDARNHDFDRQHSSRTTDLRQLDGHESWRGVYDLNESEAWGHE